MTNEELESFIDKNIYDYLTANLDIEYNAWDQEISLTLRTPDGKNKRILGSINLQIND